MARSAVSPHRTAAIFVLVLTANFRLWIFAALGLHRYARLFLLFCPLVLVALIPVSHLRGPEAPKFSRLEKCLLALWFVSLAHLANAHWITGLSFWFDLLPILGSTAYFVVIPLILLRIRPATVELRRVLDGLAAAIVILGGGFTAGLAVWNQLVGHALIERLVEAAMPSELATSFGNSYLVGGNRNIGHLITVSTSAAAVAALGTYALWRALGDPGLSRRARSFAVFIYGFAFTSVYLSTTLAPLAAFLLVNAGLALAAAIRRPALRAPLARILAGSTAWISLVAWAFPATLNRILYYRGNQDLYAPQFVPSIGGCTLGDMLWRVSSAPAGPSCSGAELHFLDWIFSFGIIPSLGWVLWMLSPFWFWKKLRALEPDAVALYGFVFTMLLSSLHYNAVAVWGNNYLYALVWALFFGAASGNQREKAA
jgi:hypothetical protein